MKTLSPIRSALLTFASIALLMATTLASGAAVLTGHGGNTIALTPTSEPNVFKDAVAGVAELSLFGNCSFSAEQIVTMPLAPGDPIRVKGSWQFTSSDGASTLGLHVEGTGVPDPANSNFVNLKYEFNITGGTGQPADVHGRGQIEAVVMLTSPTGGFGTWTLRGIVLKQRSHRS